VLNFYSRPPKVTLALESPKQAHFLKNTSSAPACKKKMSLREKTFAEESPRKTVASTIRRTNSFVSACRDGAARFEPSITPRTLAPSMLFAGAEFAPPVSSNTSNWVLEPGKPGLYKNRIHTLATDEPNPS
jgi:hypothetical protein